MKVHLATSRRIGERIRNEINNSSMEECDIFISVLYDKLVTDEFIHSKKACFNFHPGILPEYRGAGAFSWAILNGEQESGVTLHEIDKGIDHGPIIDVWKFPITDTDTAETLFQKFEDTVYRMYNHYFELLLTGSYVALPQDDTNSQIYYRKDLEQVRDVSRYARAFTFAGKANAFYSDRNGQKHEILW